MVSQALEQMLGFAQIVGQTRIYETIDTYTTGTTALYTPVPKPFQPAGNFGIGPGIGREMPSTGGLIERYRYDPGHPSLPEIHINYEIVIPGISRKLIIDNHHIRGIPKLRWSILFFSLG